MKKALHDATPSALAIQLLPLCEVLHKGKSYMSCANAREACRRRIRAHYIRVPDLEELWRRSRDRSGGESKLVRKYGNFGVLVLDE